MSRALAAVGLLTSSSCATIVSESEWNITIDTTPSGASVIVKDSDGVTIASGTTPFQVELDSGDGYFGKAKYIIEANHASGARGSASLKPDFNGWYIGNLLFGGLIGFLIVDPLTGAMYRFDDRFVFGLSGGATGAMPPIEVPATVVSMADVPRELRQYLVEIAR